MSNVADGTIEGSLGNNGLCYRQANSIPADFTSNYNISRVRRYPRAGRMGTRYPSATQLAHMGESTSDPNFGTVGLGSLYMEDLVWTTAIGASRIVRQPKVSDLNITLRDMLVRGLEDRRSDDNRIPEGEVRAMRYSAALVAQLLDPIIEAIDYVSSPPSVLLIVC
jgi:hypothetical protein